MRKILLSILLLSLISNLTACDAAKFLPLRQEIDDLQLVQAIGIDKSESGSPMISIASQNLRGGGGQESPESGGEGNAGNSEKAIILTAEGKTVFDAVQNLQTHSDRTVFWGHSAFYLISEDAAKENIAKYIDFFTRDHELRINANVYIVKGMTAQELMEQINTTDYFILDKLDALSKNIKLLSISEEMKVSELMRFIDIHHGSARVPCLQLVHRQGTGNKQIPDIDSCGYAVISDLKLAGFINKDISRGVNLITNNVGSSIVTVKDLSDQDASLEIIQSKTEVIPYFVGDELKKITIETRVKSNLGEVQSQMKITEADSINYLEKQQSEILRKEIEAVIDQALKFKSDCLDICDKIRLKRPVKWHKIEKDWMEIVQKVEFDVQVKSVIERTYEIRDPSGYKGKE